MSGRPLGARLAGALPSWQVTLGVALLLLGFLIAAQLAAEGPRVRYTSAGADAARRDGARPAGQQDELKQRIVDLREQIQDIEQRERGLAAAVRTLNASLEQARIAAGLIPLTGTGIVLKLEDSTEPVPPGGNHATISSGRTTFDRGRRRALAVAGAEAVAINDERITTSTAIIDIGGSVLVNAAYLAGPYQVSAIGPPELFARLSASPGLPGVRPHAARLLRDRDVSGRSPPPSTSRRSPARST